MAIYFSGTKTASLGVKSAIIKQLKLLNLKPVKSVIFRLDPFCEEARCVRSMMFHISSSKIRQTNPKCSVKTEVVNDRSEATIAACLDNGRSVVFRTRNMDILDVLQQWNKHITPLATAAEDLTPAAAAPKPGGKTKAGKARLRSL